MQNPMKRPRTIISTLFPTLAVSETVAILLTMLTMLNPKTKTQPKLCVEVKNVHFPYSADLNT